MIVHNTFNKAAGYNNINYYYYYCPVATIHAVARFLKKITKLVTTQKPEVTTKLVF
jgi:hypothetical protein